jgi:hypothetical protein
LELVGWIATYRWEDDIKMNLSELNGAIRNKLTWLRIGTNGVSMELVDIKAAKIAIT